MDMAPGRKEENHKTEQRACNGNPGHKASRKQEIIYQHQPIQNAQPLYFHRDNEHQQHLNLREGGGKSQEYGHINVISAEIK